MAMRYDLVVLGTGTAGATAAHICRAAGWKVAVADSRPYGGTCALRGCDPKKVLVGAAEIVDRAAKLAGRGIRGQTAIDWPALMGFKRGFTRPVPAAREAEFAQAGIDCLHGAARFLSPGRLEVGAVEIEAAHALIATGMRPQPLPIPGQERLATSDDFLDLPHLPASLVFVGGGYISFEFAHVAARAGARVTIVDDRPRPLETFDADLVERLVAASRQAGIEIHAHTPVEAVEKTGRGFLVRARQPGAAGHGAGVAGNEAAGGTVREFAAELAVHGAGRVPDLEGLDLAAAGVKYDRKAGVEVNRYLQSVSQPAIYAAGDAAAGGGPPLTPVAGYQGRIAAENLLHGNRLSPDYTGIPSVCYTLPPLARVGWTEAAARQAGLRFRVHSGDSAGWYSSRRVGETHAGYKVLIEEDSGKILGAHLLGPHAEEQINLFALAIRAGVSADRLKHAIFAYPTQGSDVPYML